MAQRETLAFEIGTEEIPAFDLQAATKQLPSLVLSAFDSVNIPHGSVKIYSTPRRLIAIVDEVAYETEAIEEVFRGPSVNIAFDEEGNPTNAALGFARGKGVEVDSLEQRLENGTEYVYARRSVPAQLVVDLLPDVLLSIIRDISWPKSCRWGTTHELFSRPVRWIVALLGDEVIPIEFADVKSGRLTFGHRVLAIGPHEVKHAGDLIKVIEEAYIVPSEQERAELIRKGVTHIEETTGCHAELPEKTFTEVMNLSEYPTVMVGTFAEEFLLVPEEIIVDAMLMHQRYFPLYDSENKLTNKFVIVSNGDPAHEQTIINGNERVVAARLYDAKFFYDEDLKKPLDTYVERLDDVVFQENLGTMLAKTDRLIELSKFIALDAGLSTSEIEDAQRAAYLCKADLVTNAVVEFTSVQGVMGRYYALASGENERVAGAIGDQYRPRFSGDKPPTTMVGRVLAVADKLDTICGLFAVDQAPTGSSDPFALRRNALGILTMLLDVEPLNISLLSAVNASLDTFEGSIDFDRGSIRSAIIEFFLTRTKVMLRDEGNDADAIDAVLAVGVQEPVEFVNRVRALGRARKDQPEAFADLATAFARAHNLRDESAGVDFNLESASDVEIALVNAIENTQINVDEHLAANDYPGAIVALAALREPIDTFFETTMIMDEDKDIRLNHMKLLNRFVEVFKDIADFSLMAKTK